MCHIHPIYMYSSIETAAPLCKILEQSDHFSWRYCISKNWGIQKCRHERSLGVNLVSFFVVSDTSPLYKIWKQSYHYLWRCCILKIWGIQSVVNECSLGVDLVIDNFCCVASGTSPLYNIWKQWIGGYKSVVTNFTSVYNLKAIGPLLMEMLHCEDLGDRECRLATNAV